MRGAGTLLDTSCDRPVNLNILKSPNSTEHFFKECPGGSRVFGDAAVMGYEVLRQRGVE